HGVDRVFHFKTGDVGVGFTVGHGDAARLADVDAGISGAAGDAVLDQHVARQDREEAVIAGLVGNEVAKNGPGDALNGDGVGGVVDDAKAADGEVVADG